MYFFFVNIETKAGDDYVDDDCIENSLEEVA